MSAQFTTEVYDIINERSGGVCEVCGAAKAWDAHHRHPRKSGSTLRAWIGLASNALATCRACHNLIESHRNLATLLGWLVPEGFDPSTQAVLYRGEYVRLLDDGSIDDGSRAA